MPPRLDPKTAILRTPQQEIWPQLAPAAGLGFVLYGSTAVALHRGHRPSFDFDFFRCEPLDKSELQTAFAFISNAERVQEDENTIVVMVPMPSGPVKVSFFGGIGTGRIDEPILTTDGVLLVASEDDLLATKLNAILSRVDATDYRDIAAMVSANVSLEKALGGFVKMYRKDPALPLKAMGYFKDGDLPSLAKADQDTLRAARERIADIPEVPVTLGSLDG